MKQLPILVGLVLLYAFAIFGASDRFSMTPFREAHTAIASYYMAKGESPFLAYEVPVLGQPWAVPMEFPLFQWIVAKVGGSDVDALRWAGRLLSLMFWGGCLWLASLISRHAPIQKEDRKWFVVLLAAAPVLVGYSATFLIESFALFFALAYLCSYLSMRDRYPSLGFALACIFGVLASLSKPTTWAPFAGVIILATGFEMLGHLKSRGELKPLAFKLARVGVIIVLPLIAGLIWVKVGDAVKMENPLARSLTSERLAGWNYGTLAQKLSPVVWGVILVKQWVLLFGVAAVILPFVLIGGGWTSFKQQANLDSQLWLLLALAGYFSAPIVFTNLHFRHDYYLFANAFFLIGAFVIALSFLRARLAEKWITWIYSLTLCSAILVSFVYIGLRQSLAEPAEDALVRGINSLSGDDAVIYFGFGWSSKMPYNVERRAWMLDISDPENPDYKEGIAKNRDLEWSAIAVGAPAYNAIADETALRLGVQFPYSKEVWPGVRLMSREPLADDTASSGTELLDRVSRRLKAQDQSKHGLVFLHSWITPSPYGESPFELMLRRGDDLFFIDGKELRLFRLRNYFKVTETTSK